MVSRLRLCRATQSARALASATVVIASTSTASCSPKIKVDVIGSKPSASPKGFGLSPTIAFPGAVKTFTPSVFDVIGAVMCVVSFVRKIISSHQQDLPDTTLLGRRLSCGRFTEWQFQANRDYQLAISHRFAHELERFPVEFREYCHHLYRRVLRGVLRCPDNRCVDSSRLDLRDQLIGGSSADRIRHRIERRKIRNRGVVVCCDKLIRADSLRVI